MCAGDAIDSSVRPNSGRHIHRHALCAARIRGSWHSRRAGRPWQLILSERTLASVCRGRCFGRCQHFVTGHGKRAVGSNLYQPRINRIVQVESGKRIHHNLDHVVVEVPVGIGCDGARLVGVGIRSEGSDALDYRAGVFVEFDNAAACAGKVERAIGKYRVENGLPEISSRPWRLPVAGERSDLQQLAVLPSEPVLAPGLAGKPHNVERPGLELHVYIVAVHQRNLIVHQQIAALLGLLRRHQGIVNDVRENTA